MKALSVCTSPRVAVSDGKHGGMLQGELGSQSAVSVTKDIGLSAVAATLNDEFTPASPAPGYTDAIGLSAWLPAAEMTSTLSSKGFSSARSSAPRTARATAVSVSSLSGVQTRPRLISARFLERIGRIDDDLAGRIHKDSGDAKADLMRGQSLQLDRFDIHAFGKRFAPVAMLHRTGSKRGQDVVAMEALQGARGDRAGAKVGHAGYLRKELCVQRIDGPMELVHDDHGDALAAARGGCGGARFQAAGT